MWIKEQSDRKLPELDTSNPGLIIERKGFEQIEVQGENGIRTEWQCDVRHISVEDFYREKQDVTETKIATLQETIDVIFGGV